MHLVRIDAETQELVHRLSLMYGLAPSTVLSHACRTLAAAADPDGSVVVFVWRESADDVSTPPLSRVERLNRTARARVTEQATGVGTVDLDEPTHALVRFAARVFNVSESEVILRAVRAFSNHAVTEARPARDPWTPLPVYGECAGLRVEGMYLPATRRLTVTSEPITGQVFRSPSGAASAVVGALKPERTAAQTNGWRFWRIVETDERLEVLR